MTTEWKDFELSFEENAAYAITPELAISVLGEGGEVFHRRAIKKHPDGTNTQESCLVARLNGVSLYVRGGTVVMTTEDLYL